MFAIQGKAVTTCNTLKYIINEPRIMSKLCHLGLVWFVLFVHPFILTCNIGYVSYRLQFLYYNTTYNIYTSTQYNE